MKNFKNIILLPLLVIFMSFSFNGCNGFGVPDYTLTVTLEDGCTGTPDAGVYSMSELDQVKYEYTYPDENIKIEVLVNNSSRSSLGTLVMYNNITLTVRFIDIRGSWEFSYHIEDGSEVKMTIIFEGDTPFAGTFSDSRGYSGTWTVDNDSFNMTYSDWEDYIFTGSITSMGGDYFGEGVQLGWTAVRLD